MGDAETSERILLSWGGTNRFATDSFTIDARLDARFEHRDRGGKVTRGGPLRLTTDDMRSLQQVLVDANVCALLSTPGYMPVPEETPTTLIVAFGGMNCAVSLYAHEWSKRPEAAPIKRAIQVLSLRTQGIKI